jgi:hypothetical protein
MRSAAIRVLVLVILGLGGVSSSAAVAGGPLDPIGTVTSVISTITSRASVVSDLAGTVTSASGSGTGAAVAGATDGVSGSGALSGFGATSSTSSGADGGSGSAKDASSGSATKSNRGSPHTRFDGLPGRYERLLERIESGRHVRANIARLHALLASASSQLRARIMRFIRLEIRRLERSGLTRRERVAVQRLRTLLSILRVQAPQPAGQGPLSLVRAEHSAILSPAADAGGAAAAMAGSESAFEGRRATSDEAGSATPMMPPPLPLPSSDPAWPLALLLLVLAAIACFVLRLTGPSRHLLPSAVRGLVEVRGPEVWALALSIGLGLVTGLVSVLLLQTVLH